MIDAINAWAYAHPVIWYGAIAAICVYCLGAD
jgi:hypothetical protein